MPSPTLGSPNWATWLPAGAHRGECKMPKAVWKSRFCRGGRGTGPWIPICPLIHPHAGGAASGEGAQEQDGLPGRLTSLWARELQASTFSQPNLLSLSLAGTRDILLPTLQVGKLPFSGGRRQAGCGCLFQGH